MNDTFPLDDLAPSGGPADHDVEAVRALLRAGAKRVAVRCDADDVVFEGARASLAGADSLVVGLQARPTAAWRHLARAVRLALGKSPAFVEVAAAGVALRLTVEDGAEAPRVRWQESPDESSWNGVRIQTRRRLDLGVVGRFVSRRPLAVERLRARLVHARVPLEEAGVPIAPALPPAFTEVPLDLPAGWQGRLRLTEGAGRLRVAHLGFLEHDLALDEPGAGAIAAPLDAWVDVDTPPDEDLAAEARALVAAAFTSACVELTTATASVPLATPKREAALRALLASGVVHGGAVALPEGSARGGPFRSGVVSDRATDAGACRPTPWGVARLVDEPLLPTTDGGRVSLRALMTELASRHNGWRVQPAMGAAGGDDSRTLSRPPGEPAYDALLAALPLRPDAETAWWRMCVWPPSRGGPLDALLAPDDRVLARAPLARGVAGEREVAGTVLFVDATGPDAAARARGLHALWFVDGAVVGETRLPLALPAASNTRRFKVRLAFASPRVPAGAALSLVGGDAWDAARAAAADTLLEQAGPDVLRAPAADERLGGAAITHQAMTFAMVQIAAALDPACLTRVVLAASIDHDTLRLQARTALVDGAGVVRRTPAGMAYARLARPTLPGGPGQEARLDLVPSIQATPGFDRLAGRATVDVGAGGWLLVMGDRGPVALLPSAHVVHPVEAVLVDPEATLETSSARKRLWVEAARGLEFEAASALVEALESAEALRHRGESCARCERLVRDGAGWSDSVERFEADAPAEFNTLRERFVQARELLRTRPPMG